MISSTDFLVWNMNIYVNDIDDMDIVVFDRTTLFGVAVSEFENIRYLPCEDRNVVLMNTAKLFFEYASAAAIDAAEKQIVPFCSHKQIKAVITDVLYTLYSTEYNSPVRRLLRAIGA